MANLPPAMSSDGGRGWMRSDGREGIGAGVRDE